MKFLGWIIFFYILYMLFKNFLPALFNFKANKQNPYRDFQDHTNGRNTGKTIIKERPKHPDGQYYEDEGEYIDYKEIK